MTKGFAMMFAVREFLQGCGGRTKTLVGENTFVTRDEAEHCLKRKFQELLTSQENWPGVWSQSCDGSCYTIDNNDGDFLEGLICEKREVK